MTPPLGQLKAPGTGKTDAEGPDGAKSVLNRPASGRSKFSRVSRTRQVSPLEPKVFKMETLHLPKRNDAISVAQSVNSRRSHYRNHQEGAHRTQVIQPGKNRLQDVVNSPDEDSDIDYEGLSARGAPMQLEALQKEVERVKRHQRPLQGLTNLAYKYARSKTLSNTHVEPETHHILEALIEIISENCHEKVAKELELHNADKWDLDEVRKKTKFEIQKLKTQVDTQHKVNIETHDEATKATRHMH